MIQQRKHLFVSCWGMLKMQTATTSSTFLCLLEIWCDIKAQRLKQARSASTQVGGLGALQGCDLEEWMPIARYQAKRGDKVAYFHFCSNYLSIKLGKAKVYNKMKCQLVLTSWAMPSDEASTLLVWENNWQLWLDRNRMVTQVFLKPV
jgi:hypothetical protein